MITGIVKKNIYSKDGILLLAKGQKLTEEDLERLRRIEIVEVSVLAELDQQMAMYWNKEKLKAKFAPIDYTFIEKSNETVSDILFLSEGKPWQTFLHSLGKYADWVYVHSIDVALISGIIAGRMNFSAQEQQEVCLGALLHDVGKLLVPREIIQKPGSLTEEEMSLVRKHCEYGCDLLKDAGLPPCSMEIVLQHHERLDGSGYPYGLSEDRISDYAKIVMVADVLDAITSYRPYKKVGSMNTALRELKGSRTKYDQRIVNMLIGH